MDLGRSWWILMDLGGSRMDLGWIWGGSGVDLGWILVEAKAVVIKAVDKV